MLSAKDLHDLAHLRAEAPGVVSLYLDLDPSQDYQRQGRTLLREASSGPHGSALADDLKRLGEFLAGFEPKGAKGLAAFSCMAAGFWQAAPLSLAVHNLLRVGPEPVLSPLANMARQHQRYGVALLDHEQARFVEVFMGAAREHAAGPDEIAARADRRIADPLHRRLNGVATVLTELARRWSFDRVILGSPADLEPLLIHHLPTQLQDNLIVDSQMGPRLSAGQVLEKVTVAETQSRIVRESVLVYRLLDAAKSAGTGVVGLAETLLALHRGEVRMLLYKPTLARMGRSCPRCGSLMLSGKKCVYCWQDTQPVLNLVADMVQMALDAGCEVFPVLHDARLDAHGGIGAELRFRSTPASPPAGNGAAMNPGLSGARAPDKAPASPS